MHKEMLKEIIGESNELIEKISPLLDAHQLVFIKIIQMKAKGLDESNPALIGLRDEASRLEKKLDVYFSEENKAPNLIEIGFSFGR